MGTVQNTKRILQEIVKPRLDLVAVGSPILLIPSTTNFVIALHHAAGKFAFEVGLIPENIVGYSRLDGDEEIVKRLREASGTAGQGIQFYARPENLKTTTEPRTLVYRI
jgi:hypothetical protein